MIEEGIYYDLSHDDYHAMQGYVSNSYLSRLAICPAAAKVPQEETDAMTFGRAFHSFILDGLTAFSRDVAILPELNLRTNDGKAAKLAFQEANKGKAIISADDLKAIMEMDRSVKAHPMAKNLIGIGANEVSIFWTDPFSGLSCKARPDTIPGQATLVDLKKCKDASPKGFLRSIIQYRYFVQAAFYLDGMSKVSNEKFDVFAFIAIESAEPYRVGVYTVSQDFINYGRSEYRRLISIEAQCRIDNNWPNYTENEAMELDIPKWLSCEAA
jgi:hypothetical protein